MRSSAADYYGADPATGIVEPGRRLVVSGKTQHKIDFFAFYPSCTCMYCGEWDGPLSSVVKARV